MQNLFKQIKVITVGLLLISIILPFHTVALAYEDDTVLDYKKEIRYNPYWDWSKDVTERWEEELREAFLSDDTKKVNKMLEDRAFLALSSAIELYDSPKRTSANLRFSGLTDARSEDTTYMIKHTLYSSRSDGRKIIELINYYTFISPDGSFSDGYKLNDIDYNTAKKGLINMIKSSIEVELENFTPLLQIDKNGKFRDWCFLATMGMVSNIYENKNYDAQSMAEKYINKVEVEKTSSNDSITSGPNIISDKQTLYKLFKLRGLTFINGALTVKSIRESLEGNNPVQLMLERYTLDKEGNIGEKLLGEHTVIVSGLLSNGKAFGYDSSIQNSIGSPDSFEVIPTGLNTTMQVVDSTTDSVYKVATALYYKGNKYLMSTPLEASYPQLSLEGSLAYIFNKYENTNYNYEDIYKMIKPEDTFNDYKSRQYGTTEDQLMIRALLDVRGYENGYYSSNIIGGKINKYWDNYNYKSTYNQMIKHINLEYTPLFKFNVYDDTGNNLGEYYAAVNDVSITKNRILFIGLYEKPELFEMEIGSTRFEVNSSMGNLRLEPKSILYIKLK